MNGWVITFLAIFVVMGLVWATFMVSYHVLTRGAWWRSFEGRCLMTLGGCFVWNAGLIIFSFIAGGDNPSAGRLVVQLVSYSTFAVVGVGLTLLLYRAQRRGWHAAEDVHEQVSGRDPVDSQ